MKNLRLIDGVTLPEALTIRDEIDAAVDLADKNAISLIRLFATIEDYATRWIFTAIGVDIDSEHWLKNRAEYRRRLSVIFPMAERLEILRVLIQDGSIRDQLEHKIKIPSDFGIGFLPFFRALQIAFEYRNSLAHNGYLTIVGRHGDSLYADPVIEARPHHLENGFSHASLNQPLVICKSNAVMQTFFSEPKMITKGSNQQASYPFIEFINSLATEFNGGVLGSSAQRFAVASTVPATELFERRKLKLKDTTDSFVKSKEKKLDALLSDLVINKLVDNY